MYLHIFLLYKILQHNFDLNLKTQRYKERQLNLQQDNLPGEENLWQFNSFITIKDK